jgi:hypothetical protein
MSLLFIAVLLVCMVGDQAQMGNTDGPPLSVKRPKRSSESQPSQVPPHQLDMPQHGFPPGGIPPNMLPGMSPPPTWQNHVMMYGLPRPSAPIAIPFPGPVSLWFLVACEAAYVCTRTDGHFLQLRLINGPTGVDKTREEILAASAPSASSSGSASAPSSGMGDAAFTMNGLDGLNSLDGMPGFGGIGDGNFLTPVAGSLHDGGFDLNLFRENNDFNFDRDMVSWFGDSQDLPGMEPIMK